MIKLMATFLYNKIGFSPSDADLLNFRKLSLFSLSSTHAAAISTKYLVIVNIYDRNRKKVSNFCQKNLSNHRNRFKTLLKVREKHLSQGPVLTLNKGRESE